MSKLLHYIKCTSKIKLLSGMHIGGPKDEVKIGGIDNPVIRNPITNLPFIPGSSLKGRFRMALELKYGDITDETKKGKDGKPGKPAFGPSQNPNNESLVVKLFGSGSPKKTDEPTRFIFRDANLSEDSKDYVQGEEKIEVKIDRKKMSAFDGGVRTQERVPAGAKFDFEVMIRIFEGDNENLFKQRLEEAKKIVEMEFLGGSGTRGYGKIEFDNLDFNKEDI